MLQATEEQAAAKPLQGKLLRMQMYKRQSRCVYDHVTALGTARKVPGQVSLCVNVYLLWDVSRLANNQCRAELHTLV